MLAHVVDGGGGDNLSTQKVVSESDGDFDEPKEHEEIVAPRVLLCEDPNIERCN